GARSRKPQRRRLIPCAARRAWTVYSCSPRKGRLSRPGPGSLELQPRPASLSGSPSGKAKQTPRSSDPDRGRVEQACRVRGPGASGDLGALLALDHADFIRALQVEPELRARYATKWTTSRSPSSGAHARDPLA